MAHEAWLAFSCVVTARVLLLSLASRFILEHLVYPSYPVTP